MRYIDTDAQDMTLSYIDSETMEIAELVASAEGISLEQAIAEELELWEGVTL
jgi:NTP pyrophosphatase (non-canonical NTP hydrolase)